MTTSSWSLASCLCPRIRSTPSSGLGADAEGAVRPLRSQWDSADQRLLRAFASGGRRARRDHLAAARPTSRYTSSTAPTASDQSQTLSFIYPPESPLPGGGKRRLRLRGRTGRGSTPYRRAIGDGDYRMHPRGLPAWLAVRPQGVVQKIFLDFDGARVNTAVFGGGGVVDAVPPVGRSSAAGGCRTRRSTGLIDQRRRHRQGEHQVRPRRRAA